MEAQKDRETKLEPLSDIRFLLLVTQYISLRDDKSNVSGTSWAPPPLWGKCWGRLRTRVKVV